MTMASSNPNTGSSSSSAQAGDTSYSAMSVGDVEAIGAHCQMPFCRQLDFLPFRCESCRGSYCGDHRTESAHSCTQAGAWARRRREANGGTTTNVPLSAKPNILTHEQQCAHPSCKTLIHTMRATGVHCDRCRRDYCLKHRFEREHECSTLTPLGTPAGGGKTQKERGLAALEKLRAWGASKKVSVGTLPSLPASKAKQSAASAAAAINALKRSAKGEANIPVDRRVYLHVEASAETHGTSTVPRGDFFYNSEWSIGRILDVAARGLHVRNDNNRSEGEEDKLRVFHIEGGRLLEFSEKLGATGVVTGHTIVLLRGVGPGMAPTPEKMGA